MIAKDFLHRVANGEKDILQLLLDILSETGSDYCVIDRLAVNAYVEPVISLDLDIIVAAQNTKEIVEAAEARDLKVETFKHSGNLSSSESDLRIQLQTDPRYQSFIPRSEVRDVLGYSMRVATLRDVLQGKVWAYSDESRRRSKRQKDLADIARLVEEYPALVHELPKAIAEDLT